MLSSDIPNLGAEWNRRFEFRVEALTSQIDQRLVAHGHTADSFSDVGYWKLIARLMHAEWQAGDDAQFGLLFETVLVIALREEDSEKRD